MKRWENILNIHTCIYKTTQVAFAFPVRGFMEFIPNKRCSFLHIVIGSDDWPSLFYPTMSLSSQNRKAELHVFSSPF